MTDWAVQSVFFCLNTAQKLPEIERNCPNTAQSHFLPKLSELPKPLIEARNYPLIFCFHYPEKKSEKITYTLSSTNTNEM